MTPFVDDPDFQLHVGDALQVLSGLPAESVHCVVTSPPYWGLRDYGTGSWDGGDDGCDHVDPNGGRNDAATLADYDRTVGHAVGTVDARSARREAGKGSTQYRDVCGRCGAHRTDHQLGLEPTPEEYVANMVAVFREVRRVLRRDGTCWLNIGDSYASQGGPLHPTHGLSNIDRSGTSRKTPGQVRTPVTAGLKPKDLVGVPWRLAFALQADGWYLRSDIIWAKPAPMPESVTDRPTKSHEYLFLLTRSARYYFDQDAVREPHSYDGRRKTTVQGQDGSLQHRDGERWPNSGRNIRTVWTINAEPFTEWGQTVRQRRVEADAPDGGKKRTTSPDCPVHGDRPVPVATAADGERADGSSSRTEHIVAGHAQASLAEFVPTGQRLEPDSALGSSDSLVPAGSPTATAHNTETRKTASRSASRGTASSETSCRTEGTSPSSALPAPDGSDSHGSSETHDRTDCTCAWYVEVTEKTSHFATFPQALVEPCVLAGTSERGCCPVCGAPWERETARTGATNSANEVVAHDGVPGLAPRSSHDRVRSLSGSTYKHVRQTTGEWRPTCTCYDVPIPVGDTYAEGQTVPCTVLDPFMGSGTTALVARRLGRRTIGIELSAEYAALAATRLQQLSLLAEGAA